MNDAPEISVIIPCHNLGRYLNQAVDSVLGQTFQDFEIIIVNAGSTDEQTVHAIENFTAPKTQIIHTPNQGLPSARNTGISAARGTYICCLDPDDYLHEAYLERTYTHLLPRLKDGVGLVTTWVQTFGATKRIWKTDTYNPPRLCLENIIHYASLYSRACWKAVGGYQKEMDQGYEDWDFWLSIVEHGYRWECIEEPLMYYRIRTNSMLSRANAQRSTIYRALVSKHVRLCQQEVSHILALNSDMQAGRDREIAAKHVYIQQLTEERTSLNRQIETSQADIASLRQQLEASQAENAFLRQEHSAACAAYEAIRTSRTWRLATTVHRGIDRLLSPVSKRRQLIRRILIRTPKTSKTIRNARWPANKPLISVIIPCHNYGEYIREAVDSVLEQTFKNYEILIIDSNSRPDTIEELRAISHPKVKVYFREDDHFVGDNRNFGIRKAKGKYICCLDADDILEPTYLEKALFVAETYYFDLVYPFVQCFQDDDTLLRTSDTTFVECAKANAISTVAVFLRKAWAHVGGYRDWGLGADHVPEDWELWVRMLGNGYRAKCLPEPLMKYRVHGHGLTASSTMPLERQAEVINEANRELFTPPNLRRIELSQQIQYQVQKPFVNLINSKSIKSVLFAFPFMIVGGADTIFLEVVDTLNQHDYEISIIATIKPPSECGDTSPRFKSITSNVYELYWFLDPSWWENYLYFLIESRNIKIIFIVGCEFVYHLTPKIKQKYHDIIIIDQLFNEIGHIPNNRKYSEFIDYNIVANEFIYRMMIEQHNERKDKVQVIVHGVDTKIKYNPNELISIDHHIPDDKFVISFMGRMSEEKAPESFVHIAHLLNHHPELFFVMTGDGPRRIHVLKLIEELGLEPYFCAPGIVDDIRPYLKRSDLVVVPSTIEGLPIIIMEAFSMGKPVVASSIGGIPSIIRDGFNGYLCDPNDLAAFADKIKLLWHDASLRAELGKNARAYAVEHLDQSNMNQHYLNVFDRFIKGRKHATKG